MSVGARGRSDGFTILEVVIALAITGLAMASMMWATQVGLGNARASEQFIEATHRAQSHLATVGFLTPIEPGTWSGDDGEGYAWHMRITTAAAPSSSEDEAGNAVPTLYRVEVTVSWLAGRSTKSVSVASERLGAGGE